MLRFILLICLTAFVATSASFRPSRKGRPGDWY